MFSPITLPPSFHLEMPARPEQVGPARRAVADFMRSQTWEGDDADDLLLAVGEACSNAVSYGGRGKSDPHFSISCSCLEGGSLQIDVRNQGDGFQPDLNTAGTMPDLDEFATHGRGFGLMLALVDDVQVLSEGESTTVRLRKAKTAS